MLKFVIKKWNVLLCMLLFLTACHSNNTKSTVFVVKAASVPHTLTYKSHIAPLQVLSVQSPADGVIGQVNVNFGSLVEKSEILLNLISVKYITDYQNAMLAYLKAKEDYVNAKNSFNGTQELWKNGLVAREEYDSQRSSLANNYAMLLQQEDALKKYLPPGTTVDPNWSLEDKAKLLTLFSDQRDLVNIYAPVGGVVMGPAKSNSSSTGGNENLEIKLMPGIQVHQGDSLLTIANLEGFNFEMSASEMDINNIEKNMPATITSDAFSEVLKGYVSYVSIQAKSTMNDSSLPEFPIEVVVPHINKNLLKKIRLGMSVKVTIDLGSPKQLLIPLDAIGDEHGKDVVKKLDKQGRMVITPVTTGDTTIDQIAVLTGLNDGDKILVPY